jgi:hypothetical protein
MPPVTLLSLPVELILQIGEDLRDAHDLPCRQYRNHAYGDFNAFLQINSKFHQILNPILWKEAAECRITTGRAFAHLIRTNNAKSLKSFLALGVNREAPLHGFRPHNPKLDSTIDIFTPLVAAAYLDNVQLVRILLDSGAKVQYNRYDHEDLSYYCAMHAARSEEMVHVLMEYGGDIELVDSEKWTPLHWFSRRNNVEAMLAVLWAGAEVDPIGGELDYESHGLGMGPPTGVGGRTPLHEAAQYGNAEAISVLMAFGTDLYLRDETMKTALHIAVEAKRANVVRQLAEVWPQGTMEKNGDKDTALHLAARSQQTDTVKLLAQVWPAVVKEKNNKLDTALHVAARKGDAEMVGVLVEFWPGGKKERNNDGEIPLATFLARLKRLEKRDLQRERLDKAGMEKIIDLLSY